MRYVTAPPASVNGFAGRHTWTLSLRSRTDTLCIYTDN